MAEVVKKAPAKQNNAFDITRFSEDFAKANVLRDERQAQEKAALDAEQAAQADMMEIGQRSQAVKQDYLDGLAPLVDSSKKIAEASQKQMTLQQGGIIDQLQAMQDAMVNPRLGTSEGRAKLRAELNAQAATIATEAEAQQNVLSGEMDLVKMGLALKQGGLKKASLLEAQHAEVMKAEAIRVDTIRSGLQSNAQAKQLLMDQMTPEQLTAAKSESVKNNGTVNSSGFDINTAEIDAEIAKRMSIQYDLQTKSMAIAANNRKMIEDANEKILAALNSDQLTSLQLGKPVEVQFANGEKQTMTLSDFNLGQVNAHAETKQKAFADKITQSTNAIMWGDTRKDITERLAQQDSIIAKVPVGSPEYISAVKRKQELEGGYKAIDAAEKLVDPNSPATKVFFDSTQAKLGELLKKGDEQDAKTVESAAKKMGRGDTDLTTASREFLTGQPVSQQAVVDYVTKKAANNEDVSAMLGQEAARLFKKNYETQLEAYRSKNGGLNQALMTGDKIGQKEYKQEIAYQALMTTVNQMSQQHTDTFIGAQAQLNVANNKDLVQNPIANARDSMGRKIWSPEAFVGFVATADRNGLKNLRETAEYQGLDEGSLGKLMNGESVTIGDKTYDASLFQRHLLIQQNVALLESLDNTRPGLAKEYVDWWTSQGTTYGKEYINTQMSNGGKNLSDAAIMSMSASQVEAAMSDYGSSLAQVFDEYKGIQQKQRQDWISYDLSPANRQAALLQFDPTLSNDEKTLIFRQAIKPLLAEASKQGLDFEKTNIMIERAWENPQQSIPGFAENAALKKAVNKMIGTRNDVVTQLQALTDSPWLYGNNQKLADSIWNNLGDQSYKRNEAKSIGGSDLFGGMYSTQTTPRGINTGVFGSYDGWLKDETRTRPYDWYRNLIMEEGQTQDKNGGM